MAGARDRCSRSLRSTLAWRSSRAAPRCAARWFGCASGLGSRVDPAVVRVAGPRGRDAALLRLEVGDHLLAFVAAQRAGAREVLLGVFAQARERGAPGDAVGLEHRELFGRGLAVDLGLHVLLELPLGELQRRRRAHPPSRSSVAVHVELQSTARARRRSHLCIRAYISAGQLGGHCVLEEAWGPWAPFFGNRVHGLAP